MSVTTILVKAVRRCRYTISVATCAAICPPATAWRRSTERPWRRRSRPYPPCQTSSGAILTAVMLPSSKCYSSRSYFYSILSLVPPKEVFFFSQCSRSVFLLDPDPGLRTEFELRIPNREANDLRIRLDPNPTAWPFLLPLEKICCWKGRES